MDKDDARTMMCMQLYIASGIAGYVGEKVLKEQLEQSFEAQRSKLNTKGKADLAAMTAAAGPAPKG